MTEIAVWYQLYGKDGKPFQESCPTKVRVAQGANVAILKDAIYAKTKPIHAKLVASFLKVYKRDNQGSSSASSDIVDLKNQKLLGEECLVSGLGDCMANSLIVVVPDLPQSDTLEPLVGKVVKVCINQSKLLKKYLTPIGSNAATLAESTQNNANLSNLALRLENSMFTTNSCYQYCIVVNFRKPTVELIPPSITIVLITAFSDKPLERALAQDDFKRVMPISPTPAQDGTGIPIVTTPEWIAHPEHKTPCYVLCIPIQVYPAQLIECDEDYITALDADNLQKLKEHLVSLGGLTANSDYVDSDEEEEDDYDWE